MANLNRRIQVLTYYGTLSFFLSLCFLLLLRPRHMWSAVQPVHPTLVIGTFSTAPQVEQRAAIRESWASSSLICSVKRHLRKPGCHVWHYFVVGFTDTMPHAEFALHEDFIFLSEPENMNEGKTFDFFLSVFSLHPDADFYAKTDMDTFVDVLLLDRLLLTFPSPYIYFGFENSYFICGGAEHCPKDWQYMSGQFYALGHALVSWLSGNKNLHLRKGDEDLQIGRTLQLYDGPLLYFPCNRAGLRCPFVHNIKNTTLMYELWTKHQLDHETK